MNIYVGNVASGVNENQLRDLFSQYGTVTTVTIIKDKFTGESRGFAFVEMPDATEGQNAIANVNGIELNGRRLRVNEARPREERPANGGGGRPRRPYGSNGGGNGGNGGSRFGGPRY